MIGGWTIFCDQTQLHPGPLPGSAGPSSSAWLLSGYDPVIVGRRKERLEAFADSHLDVKVRVAAADMSTGAGIDAVAGICAAEPLTMLVNNAGSPATCRSAAKAR